MQAYRKGTCSGSSAASGAHVSPKHSIRRALRPRMRAASTQEAVQQQQQQPVTATQFLRPHLLQLAAYTPIEPFEVLSKRYGKDPQDIVKLDANENPYGPPPEVRQALASMPFPHIYPDPETRQLRKALAEWNDIPMERLLVSRQSDS
eukprot:GHRQ01029265.1.p1 GENE.GHRQ01029265.1~~GHRQ01029265.1.p1  ORF type:complete len:148 (+),score=25.76 GHRQ01029265.1:478-921(+)